MKTNVVKLLAVAVVISVMASAASAATWVSAPDVGFMMDPVKLRVALTDQSNWWKLDVEKLFTAQNIRAGYVGKTGITEPTYALSILSGLPQEFWGGYLDWRNPANAIKGMRYLIEVVGFDPMTTGIAMIQDGYGVNSGFHQTFRIYFPCVLKDGVVNIMIDKEYLLSVGVAPETTRLIWFTNQTKTSWTGKEPPLHPFPVETTATSKVVMVSAIADCGCDHDNSGKDGRSSSGEGKGTNEVGNNNKEKCKQKINGK